MDNYSSIDFCKQVSDSYSFDGQVAGLDDLAQGAVVKEVSREALADSGRFKRSELTARLAAEPNNSMTLYMDTRDLKTTQVLTEDGAYSTTCAPGSVPGCIMLKPLPGDKRKLTIEDAIYLLHAA